MRLLSCVLALLCFVFGIFSGSAYATLPAPTVGILNKNDLYPGGFAVVMAIPITPLPIGALSCGYLDISTPFFRLNKHWYAILPIPFSTPTGMLTIGISMDNVLIAPIAAEIKQKPHKITRLGPASPLAEHILERIAREKEATNAVFTAYDPLPRFEGPGGFILPVADAHITDQYGTKRIRPSRTYYHAGVDFRARSPVKIVSAANGIVVYTASHFLEGNIIIVSHGAGIHSCYVHLSRIKVGVGQVVRKGQLIAYSGKTGAAARGPHLHFLIKAHNIPIDPLLFIKSMNALQ